MKSTLMAVVLSTICFVGCGGCNPETSLPTKKIAITLDDAPVVGHFQFATQAERMDVVTGLKSHLATFKAPVTVFAIGRDLESEDSRAIMALWKGEQIEVGNHSYSHLSFNTHVEPQMRNEFQLTNQALQPFKGKGGIRYFRFPFLQEGATLAQEKLSNKVLKEAGLLNAKVTIGTDDWTYNAQYTDAVLAGNTTLKEQIGRDYLVHIKKNVAFWDSVGVVLEKRHVKHVMVLHANRINRVYLGDILESLKQEGYQFIDLDEAYQDVVYSRDDEWATATGVSWLEHVKQTRLLQGKY